MSLIFIYILAVLGNMVFCLAKSESFTFWQALVFIVTGPLLWVVALAVVVYRSFKDKRAKRQLEDIESH